MDDNCARTARKRVPSRRGLPIIRLDRCRRRLVPTFRARKKRERWDRTAVDSRAFRTVYIAIGAWKHLNSILSISIANDRYNYLTYVDKTNKKYIHKIYILKNVYIYIYKILIKYILYFDWLNGDCTSHKLNNKIRAVLNKGDAFVSLKNTASLEN